MDYNALSQLTEIKYKSLIDHLHKSRDLYPDKPVFLFKGQSLTYRMFANHVEDCARALAALGLTKGKTVALVLPNVLEFCVLYYALLQQAVRVLPVNIMLTAGELENMVLETGTDAIFVWHRFSNLIQTATADLPSRPQIYRIESSANAENIDFYRTLPKQITPPSPTPKLQKQDDALVFYSAGTSEAPRGVLFTHESISCTLRSLWETLLIADADMILAAMPLFHPFGQMVTMNVPIAAGSTIVLHTRLDIDEIIDSIEQHKITYLLAVPHVFDEIAKKSPDPARLKSLRVCLASGAILKDESYTTFQKKYNLTILEGYGVIECSPLVSCSRIYRERRRGSVGLPLPDIEVAILDEEKYQPLSPNEIGEIGLRSKSLMKGYIGNGASLEKLTKNGWFLTGDIGMMDSDGYLFLIDRKADIILKDGFLISPIDIEKVLGMHQSVHLAAAIGVKNKMHGEIIRAFVVPAAGTTLNANELKNFCLKHLPVYKCPDEIDIVQDLPRTATGKVLKRELRRKVNEASTNVQ